MPHEDPMERRSANRYPLRMRASVQSVGAQALPEPLETWTQDISGHGLFLELGQPLAVGTRLRLTLQLASETDRTMLTIHCLSRVVRVVGAQGSKRRGVGAVIEEYELVRPPGSAPSQSC